MKPETPLVQQKYLLEKYPGKGGWTYAQIPEIPPDPHADFGWVRVKGSIDGVELKGYHLMPMGNGKLFLPVKAAIRKKIKKEAGDWVEVILFPDPVSIEMPTDFLLCLKENPELHDCFFQTLNETEQQAIIAEINASRSEEDKIERMGKILNRLEQRVQDVSIRSTKG